MSIYVTANLCFNNASAAKSAGLSIENYNGMIIEKWNKVISKDDTVYVLGNLGNSPSEIKKYINMLNGSIIIISSKYSSGYSVNEWKNNGIFDVATYVYTECKKSNKSILFIEDSSFNNDNYKLSFELPIPYQNNTLSVDLKYWDYTPIELNEIETIIERMKQFEEMEEVHDSNN